MPKYDKNDLRAPNTNEMADLPTSMEDAVKQKLNVYLENDQPKKIRFKERAKPNKLGIKGEIEDYSKWKDRGHLSKGKRPKDERLSTPEGADKKAYRKAMSKARTQGLEGDHNYSVARTGNALREMTPERRQTYHQRYKDAGIDLGNQEGNITARDTYTNQVLKRRQELAVDKAIKGAGSESDQIFSNLRSARLRIYQSNMIGLAPEILQIVDEKTDGAISETINGTVENGKKLVSDGVDGWKNIITKMLGQQTRQQVINYGQY